MGIPKIDELIVHAEQYSPDMILITETWLCESILDNVVNIPVYCRVRRDRVQIQHGGVCIYLTIYWVMISSRYGFEYDHLHATQY